jgi:hypothetical protein
MLIKIRQTTILVVNFYASDRPNRDGWISTELWPRLTLCQSLVSVGSCRCDAHLHSRGDARVSGSSCRCVKLSLWALSTSSNRLVRRIYQLSAISNFLFEQIGHRPITLFFLKKEALATSHQSNERNRAHGNSCRCWREWARDLPRGTVQTGTDAIFRQPHLPSSSSRSPVWTWPPPSPPAWRSCPHRRRPRLLRDRAWVEFFLYLICQDFRKINGRIKIFDKCTFGAIPHGGRLPLPYPTSLSPCCCGARRQECGSCARAGSAAPRPCRRAARRHVRTAVPHGGRVFFCF